MKRRSTSARARLARAVGSALHTLPALALLAAAPAHAAGAASTGAATSGRAITVRGDQPLAQLLLGHHLAASRYTAGIAWYAQAQQLQQAESRQALIDRFADLADRDPAHAADDRAMQTLIASMPTTGRVVLSQTDPRYLQARPETQPLLAAGDVLALPRRPHSVAVVRPDGQVCRVRFVAGALALAYVRRCTNTTDATDAATLWIAQPDGRVQRADVAAWNEKQQDPPGPGAWIVLPGAHWPQRVARGLAEFLATQPPAAQQALTANVTPPFREQTAPPLQLAPELALQPAQLAIPPARDLAVTANDWGMPGLLQEPSARMYAVGEAAASISHVYPYTRLNFMFQPLSWLELGFRYTSVLNQLYGPQIAGNQSYKDKSADVRLRLHEETRWWPQVALGIQDVGGTGLFSGEYMVASKRTGNFDWTAGLGWGYLGGRQNLPNPLGLVFKSFKTRPSSATASGGTFSIKTFFHGRTAPFAGVQYQTPLAGLILKAEVDANNYRHEPFGEVLPQRSPLNFGLVYRINRNVDFALGYERGNTVQAQFTLHGDLAHVSQPKIGYPAEEPLQPAYAEAAARTHTIELAPENDSAVLDAIAAQRAGTPPPWAAELAQRIDAACLCHVSRVRDSGPDSNHTLIVQIDNVPAYYLPPLVERIARVLVLHAPHRYTQFKVLFDSWGIPTADFRVDRSIWLANHSELQPPALAVADTTPAAPPTPRELRAMRTLLNSAPQRYTVELGPGYQQSLGGPNGFILYQISANAKAIVRITPRTWLTGDLNYGLLNNYSKFTYDAPSNLPRVRTYIREYVTSSRLTVPLLQLTHVGYLGEHSYYSVYGGALEPMFAGVGGEALYRPANSALAYGADLNYVRQRGFTQHFSLLPYHVLTGHATVYWKPGVDGLLARLSVGQYLARDKGATLDLSRTFANGVQIGVYATKTNVSAAQFGEGSFDKGLYINVPFDAMLTRSSSSVAHLLWQPLLRDGGARLDRAYPLYDLTRNIDSDNALQAPAH
jgi:hypothetical protein